MNEEKWPEKEQQGASQTTNADISGTVRGDAVIGPGASINHHGLAGEQFVNALNQQNEALWKRFDQLLDMHSSSRFPQTHADLLLITATDVETAAILKHFPAHEDLFIPPNTYYDFGTIAGARVCLVQSEKGAAGVGGSLQTTTESINALSPAAIIMVGIAFGARPDEQNIGDILVAQQIMAYDPQKISTLKAGEERKVGAMPRGDRVTVSPWLLSRCHHGYAGWSEARVHFGLLLSGDKLIDNQEYRDYLLTLEPEAIGGEMEGAGLYVAAQHGKVHWIVVKAICDWADGNKGGPRKHDYQQLAADNAARFVSHIIQKGGFHH